MPTTAQLIEEALKEFDKWFNHGTRKEPRFAHASGAYKEVREFFEQALNTMATKSAGAESVYVLTAYDTEKERLGEIIVIDDLTKAQELEKLLIKNYGAINVTFASRKINDVPVVLQEALSQPKEELND